MHERLMERVEQLKRLYLEGAGNIVFHGENGRKTLVYLPHQDNPDYSNQGGLMWMVTHKKRDHTSAVYGPMDTRELKMMHPELFWNGEIQ